MIEHAIPGSIVKERKQIKGLDVTSYQLADDENRDKRRLSNYLWATQLSSAFKGRELILFTGLLGFKYKLIPWQSRVIFSAVISVVRNFSNESSF